MAGQKLLRYGWIPLLLLLLAPAGPAQANVGPPTQKLTLIFADQQGQAITPAAIQIAQCDSAADPACNHPQLVAQYGACDAPGCLSDAGFVEEHDIFNTFKCGDPTVNVCLYSARVYGLSELAQYRMILWPADPSAGGVASGTFTLPEDGYNYFQTFQVTVAPPDLGIVPIASSSSGAGLCGGYGSVSMPDEVFLRLVFTFADQAAQPLRPAALQLARCAPDDPGCTEPVLVRQYGVCRAAGCLPEVGEKTGLRDRYLTCAWQQQNRCLHDGPVSGFAGRPTTYALRALFPDAPYASRAISGTFSLAANLAASSFAAWQVDVSENGLAIHPDARVADPGPTLLNDLVSTIGADFRFVDEAGREVPIVAAQIARCDGQGSECFAPDLLNAATADTGDIDCSVAGCIAGLAPADDQHLLCGYPEPNTCSLSGRYGYNPLPTRYILIGQFTAPTAEVAEPVALSGTFTMTNPWARGPREWRVVVAEDGLQLVDETPPLTLTPTPAPTPTATPSPPPPTLPPIFGALPLAGFLLTLAAELAIALLFLLALRIPRPLVGGTLFAIVLVDLVTYPVVWRTFPALQPYTSWSNRVAAALTLLAAVALAMVLVRLKPAYDAGRRAILVGLLTIAAPLAGFLLFAGASAVSAALGPLDRAPAATAAGLPYLITMPASEVFAVVVEALLLAALCRPALSRGQAVALSLLANAGSFVLGLLLLPLLLV